MVARILVTTGDERTWLKHKTKPLLFLGDWCIKLASKKEMENLDYQIVPYHWDDRKKLYIDYKYLDNIYENILVTLSKKLNTLHDVNYELDYWRILLGPWLSYFIQILFDRWSMLNFAINEYEISGFSSIKKTNSEIPANDFLQAEKNYINDEWNEMIYGQLIQFIEDNKINVENILVNDDKNQSTITKENKSSFKSNFLVSLIKKITGWFPNDHEHFFISTYLFLLTDLRLQLRLKQIPRIWEKLSIPNFDFNIEMRNWSLNLSENSNIFEKIVNNMIPLHIPRVYLEGYGELMKCIDDLPWPKHPKSIFTSNNHVSDDIFKAWAAKKKQEGVPLFIGQHGGHFGMTPFSFHEKHEITIADKWLSWGWSDAKRKQVKPVGNLIGMNHKLKHNPKGKALMVEMNLPRYSYQLYAAPIAGQVLSYLDDQCAFIDALPEKLKKELILRLFHNDYDRGLHEYWSFNAPNVTIDSGVNPISSLIKNSRLYISTYNATSYLESLAWNIPTIIFWNSDHWELNNETKPFFNKLKKVGIFHSSPESAAKQMISIWDNIPAWWSDQDLQKTRQEFCRKYSHLPDNPINELETIFKNGV